jgi:hypothetical protein
MAERVREHSFNPTDTSRPGVSTDANIATVVDLSCQGVNTRAVDHLLLPPEMRGPAFRAILDRQTPANMKPRR